MRKRKEEPVTIEDSWRERIERSKQHQRANSKNWSRNKGLIFGDQANEYESDRQQAPWKQLATLAYGWGMCEALTAAIFAQNPSGVVDAYDSGKMPTTGMLSQIMRFDFDQMNTRDLMPLAITDMFINGYSAVIECVKNEKKWVAYPNATEGSLGDPVAADEETEGAQEALLDQRFEARRIHPKDFLADPAGTLLDLSDSSYCAVAWYPTVAELQGDKSFSLPEGIEDFPECHSGSRETKTESGSRSPRPGSQQQSEEKDPKYRRILVWEVHDKVNHRLVYVTDHGYHQIGTAPWPAQLQVGGRDLFAITLFYMHPNTEGLYPKAEVDLVANQLMILNRLDAVIYEDAVTKWRKYVSAVGLQSNDQAAKTTDSALGNDLIQVDPDSLDDLMGQDKKQVDVRSLIMTLEDIAPKKDMLAVRELVKSEIHEILGYGPLDRGGMPKTRSAREAVAIKEQLGARMEPRRAAIERFFQDFGQKHLMFLQQKMALPRYVKIFPEFEREAAMFLQYKPEDLEGNFQYRVLSDTSTPQTNESRKASELQLFQSIAPIIQATGGDITIPFRRLAVAYQWEGVDELFKNHKAVLQNLAALLVQFKTGTVKPEQLLEAAAQAVSSGLSPAEIKNITQVLAGGMGGGGQANPASTTMGNRGDQNPMGTSAGTM